MENSRAFSPIGIFDSGVGGLSIFRAIREELPLERIIYIADQANVPYGKRTLENVRQLSEKITEFLVAEGSKIIVVACNTASAASLHYLRDVFPDVPFVGMEPAVKPAAEITRSGYVGVLATPATFQGNLYASVIERFANGVNVLQDTCPGLVEQIEAGYLDTYETRFILENTLKPMLEYGIDTVVLGCTHYPFVIPLIKEIVGTEVRVIDPAPAIARQTRRVLHLANLLNLNGYTQNMDSQSESIRMLTSGDPDQFELVSYLLLGESSSVGPIKWSTDGLR